MEGVEIIEQVAVINIPDTTNTIERIGQHLVLQINDADICPDDCSQKVMLTSCIDAIEKNLNKLKQYKLRLADIRI